VRGHEQHLARSRRQARKASRSWASTWSPVMSRLQGGRRGIRSRCRLVSCMTKHHSLHRNMVPEIEILASAALGSMATACICLLSVVRQRYQSARFWQKAPRVADAPLQQHGPRRCARGPGRSRRRPWTPLPPGHAPRRSRALPGPPAAHNASVVHRTAQRCVQAKEPCFPPLAYATMRAEQQSAQEGTHHIHDLVEVIRLQNALHAIFGCVRGVPPDQDARCFCALALLRDATVTH
jgi:hypothetical protein